MPDPNQPDLQARSSASTMDARRDDALESISTDLARRGLGAPASILLDAHRPLLPILRLAGIFLTPLASPLVGRWRLDRLAAMAADPTAYDRLTARLATRGAESGTASRTSHNALTGEQEA
ncbi:MAG: hypothetical protein OEW24_03510 [Chloroflexota bacterium]|nr:hypothetical protein [Chloroflexota bacterium]